MLTPEGVALGGNGQAVSGQTSSGGRGACDGSGQRPPRLLDTAPTDLAGSLLRGPGAYDVETGVGKRRCGCCRTPWGRHLVGIEEAELDRHASHSPQEV